MSDLTHDLSLYETKAREYRERLANSSKNSQGELKVEDPLAFWVAQVRPEFVFTSLCKYQDDI